MRSLIAIAVALGCVGCGSSSVTDSARSSAPPYGGPLNAKAAVAALQCSGRTPFERSAGDYGDGLASVQSGATDAFDNYIEETGIGYHAPREGYRVERTDEHRALLSYDVADRTKVAVVVADGIRDFNDDVGWGVVAWAQCDPAELPAAVTDDLDIGIWEDGSGKRLPFRRVHSFPGPEHCNWTDTTFLLIGPDERRADWYVRHPSVDFTNLLRTTYDADATLPDDARATGWRRGGRELWLDHEAAYLVAVDDPDDVERWPAAKEPILCA